VLVCDGNNKRLRLIPMDKTTGQPGMSRTIFAGSGSIASVTESADGEIFVTDVRAQQVQRIDSGKAIVIAGHPVSQALPTGCMCVCARACVCSRVRASECA
jgi:hypothetical protein